jgi:hypothetical protein
MRWAAGGNRPFAASRSSARWWLALALHERAGMGHGRSGSAVVTSVRPTSAGTVLELRLPSGVTEQMVLTVPPDEAAGRLDCATVRRPLSVLIRLAPDSADCVLLGTSRHGPVRRKTSLGSALALCECGVHTVVVLNAASSMSPVRVTG